MAAIVSAIACPFALCAYPQTAAPTPAPASAKSLDYSAESIVIEHVESIYTFAADGSGTEDRAIVARVQTDAAVRALGVARMAYAADSQHLEFLYARVRHPDGSIVESTPSDAIDMPQPVTREAPLYSDLKEKQLPIRSLHVGDTLEWKARITTTKSLAPGQFWGQERFVDDTVVLSETLELRVPAGLAIKVWSPSARPVESDSPAAATTPALHIYRWTSSQLKPTAGKQADAEAEAKKKAVWTAEQELDADQGKLPSIAWTTFKSWQEVGAWYRSLEADRIAPSPEVKAKVAELIAGKSTDEEKVRALYAYVATQIRYISVAFGMGRYQPHTAAETLGNQYGDCKDKHTLLASMLAAAGIPSDAILIGEDIRFNPDVPSPSAFNHVMTHLTLSAAPGDPPQPVWLDTTAEIAPYQMLDSVIRDKQALIVPAAAAPYVARTPAEPPIPFIQTWQAAGTLDSQGTTHAHFILMFQSETELELRYEFHQTSPARYGQLVQQYIANLRYEGTSSNAEVTNPDDTTVPLKIEFDYEHIKGCDWEHYRIAAQLPNATLPRFTDQDPLVRSIDLGSPRTEVAHAALKLPEGWGATLPDAIHLKSAYATYDETYRLEKGTLYSERILQVLQQHVPTSALKDYKKWADDAKVGEDVFIQLTRP